MDKLGNVLKGIKVVDFGTGQAPALAAKMLADLGASVIRFEPASGDPFHDVYPAYRAWHAAADVRTADTLSDRAVTDALATADICISGGEDWPGLDWRPELDAFSVVYPRLVAVDISGYPEDNGRPSHELLVQARSGVAFEQFSARPMQYGWAAGGTGAGQQAVVAALAGLCAREQGATDLIARTSLYEGMLTWVTSFWYSAERPAGSFNFVLPKDPYPLIFKCRDGAYIHFVLGSLGSKGRIYRILNIDDPTVDINDPGTVSPNGPPKNFFGDIDVLAAHVINFDSAPLLADIQAAGVAAELVLAPGECWDDVQVRHIGLVKTDNDGTAALGLPVSGEIFSGGGKPATTDEDGSGGPLAGKRVLDFGLFVAGPFGSVALGDLGADVIKVETPGGDPNRNVFRSHAAVNRGKRSLAIDMKKPQAKEIIERLCASADIILNNFRPGVSARLGIDPATLRKADPGKICIESTGYGRTGPKGDRPGFDMVFQAFCGMEKRAGGEGNEPLWSRTSMVDYCQGLMNSVAALAAMYNRLRTGGGADMESTLLGAGMYLMSDYVRLSNGEFAGPAPLNHTQTGMHPAEALYQADDGWIAIAAVTDTMAKALADALGIADQCEAARSAWGHREADAITEAVHAYSVADILDRLEAAGVWAEHCVENGAVMLDDASRPYVATTRHSSYGAVRQIGPLFRMDGGRVTAKPSLPDVGGDTKDILSELGYSDDDIATFYAEKVVA